jgi:hypothetical protein
MEYTKIVIIEHRNTILDGMEMDGSDPDKLVSAYEWEFQDRAENRWPDTDIEVSVRRHGQGGMEVRLYGDDPDDPVCMRQGGMDCFRIEEDVLMEIERMSTDAMDAAWSWDLDAGPELESDTNTH